MDDLVKRLRFCPNIEHARILMPKERVPECVVPIWLRDEAAQAITDLQAQLAEARADALEEAAKVAGAWMANSALTGDCDTEIEQAAGKRIAAAIRNLKEPTP